MSDSRGSRELQEQIRADRDAKIARRDALAIELRGLYGDQAEFEAAIDALPDGLTIAAFNEELRQAITARRAFLELSAAELEVLQENTCTCTPLEVCHLCQSAPADAELPY